MELTIEQALQQGVAAHKEGKVQDAERLYRVILQSQPLHPDANHNLGLIVASVNQADVALPLFKAALEANPKIEQFWLSYIDALIKGKQFDNAKEVLEQAEKHGVARENLNSLRAQLASIPKTKITNVTSPSQQQLDGLLECYQNGQFVDAEQLALSITEQYPEHQFGWKVLGALLKQTGRISESLVASQKSVQLAPQDPEAHNNLGITLQELGRLAEAEASCRQAIVLKSDYAEAHSNLGVTLQELGRLEEAEASYNQAIALKPDFAEAHNNLGITFQALGRFEVAEVSYRQAIAMKPDYAEAYNNLGMTLKELGRLDEAEASLRHAIALKSDYAEAHNNLGNTLQELGRLEPAEASFRQAIALGIGYMEAHRNLANILRELGRIEEAIESDRYAIFLSSAHAEETEPEKLSDNSLFKNQSPIEYPALYRAGMGTENVGGFLRAMAHMLRPKNILEIGAGYTTPFLLEALINNERVYDDGNLQASYFNNYIYAPKLVIIDNMSLGQLSKKPGMDDIISSKYTQFMEGDFEGKAELLHDRYGDFDFVWFDCGGPNEYKKFIDEYWDICSDYIFFHFTYSDGSPNENHEIIRNSVTGNPSIFDIVEPHKSRQGSITMVRKNNFMPTLKDQD